MAEEKIITVDYIEEQNTDGIWTYRKWSSGIVECWGNTSVKDYAINSTYNDSGVLRGYYCAREYFSFPKNLFVSAPTVSACFNSKNYGIPLISMSDLGKNSVALLLYEGVSTTRNGFYAIYAVGKWKE